MRRDTAGELAWTREQDLGRLTIEIDLGYRAISNLGNERLGFACSESRQNDPPRVVDIEREHSAIPKPQENDVPAHSALSMADRRGRDAIATKSATTSSSGRRASSSCVQLSLRSGSTRARSSRIIARSTGVFP